MRSAVVVVALVFALVFVVVAESGCVECEKSFDCAIGEQCVDGNCALPLGDGISLAAPADAVVDEVFDLTLAVRFRGPQAVLRVDALDGDDCLPFVPQSQILIGDEARAVEQDVVFAGLFARGPAFRVRAVLDVNGKETVATFALRGPDVPDDVGGFSFAAPGDDDADAVAAPWVTVAGDLDGGRAFAFVEPVGGVTTPRVAIAENVTSLTTVLPLVRGPQVLWIEREQNGAVDRCGHGVLGGPAGDDDGALELALLTDGPSEGWLDLSLRFADEGAETAVVCDVDRDDARCRRVVTPVSPELQNAQVTHLFVDEATVEVAAVPLAISPPLTAWIRVSRGGRHVGFFGPFTVFPDRGQAWFAGRILVRPGLTDLAPVDENVTAPW